MATTFDQVSTGLDELIPSPSVVREKLGQNIRDGQLLRRLYRLSIKAAELKSIGNDQAHRTSTVLTMDRGS